MKKYSEAIKLEARKLVRSGLTRRETGRQLGLDDRLICIWCADIPATKGKVFSKELAEKARALLKSGKTKLQASKELNVSYEWVKYHTVGIETKKHISFELETKANELVDSGMQKKEVAKTLNLNYEWVKRHTKLHNHFTLYPQKLRENVQRLSKQGFNPSFIERSFNLPKRTAGNWIAYAKRQEYLKIGDRSLVILRKLIENGYFIPRGHQIDACKILSKQLPIKMVRYSHKKRIYFLSGNERNAIAAFVSRYYHNNVGSRRLKRIMNTFGIEKYNRTLLEENDEFKIYKIKARYT